MHIWPFEHPLWITPTKCMLLAKGHAGAWLIIIPYCIHYPSTRVNVKVVVQSQTQVSLHRQWNWIAGQAMAEPFFS